MRNYDGASPTVSGFLFVLRECSNTGQIAGFCPMLERRQA
jgi:hypothetical protein